MKAVDDQSVMGRSYPAEVSACPEGLPVGVKCQNVETSYGLFNESKTVTFFVEICDSKGVRYTAKFVLDVK